jgi:tetratricopeptide (TPR) repeat protein
MSLPPRPPVLLLGISIPRSGHHFLATLLEQALGRDLRYCEYYSEEDCCKSVPCTRRTGHLVTYQKHHDLDLTVDPQLPGVSYVVQYRNPVPAVISDRELFAEVRGSTLATDPWQYQLFLADKGAHYVKFYDKWVRRPGPRSFVMKYEALLDAPANVLAELFQFAGLDVASENLARAVAAVTPRAHRPPIVAPAQGLGFQPRVAARSRYFDAELLGAYESIVLERVAELRDQRTFAPVDYRDHPLFALFSIKCAMLEGRPEDAAKEAVGALARWPGHSHVIFVAGDCLRRIGRNAEAVPHLEKACALAPHDAEVLISCAHAHLASGTFDRAVEHAAAVVALLPTQSGHRLFLASVLLMAGRPRDAAEQALHALDLGITEPHHWPAFSRLVREARRQGWPLQVATKPTTE